MDLFEGGTGGFQTLGNAAAAGISFETLEWFLVEVASFWAGGCSKDGHFFDEQHALTMFYHNFCGMGRQYHLLLVQQI